MSNLSEIRKTGDAIRSATNLRPGDRVLLTTSQQIPPDSAAMFTDQMREFFPGVEFMLIAGVANVMLDRQDETDESFLDYATRVMREPIEDPNP